MRLYLCVPASVPVSACVFLFLYNFFIKYSLREIQFAVPAMGKATGAARAALPIPTYQCLGFLTPSLPHPIKFPGWKMQRRACKQYIFWSYNTYFQCYTFLWKSFHMPVRKKKGLKVSHVALLLVVFKWLHGSEEVNVRTDDACDCTLEQ